jgi:hypothetical protein
MYEHGEPSKGFPVVDLTLEDEDATFNTSRDEKTARKLFDDLNCGFRGPPDDGNIIVLSNSEEEKEVCKDNRTNVETTPSSARNSLAPIASSADNDDEPDKVQGDSSGGTTPV